MILFKRCCECKRLVLAGMYRWLDPKPPPITCGHCRRVADRAAMQRLRDSINTIKYLRDCQDGDS